MAQPERATPYERWIREQGLPIVRGHGIADVATLELAPWDSLGGRGAFIQLQGMEGLTGMYVAEIPPAGALEPEAHLYDELIYILSGRGITEVWNPGSADKRGFFEWQAGALFAPPLNTRHRLLNTSGSEPARFLAVTTAPMVLDLYHSPEFVFDCDYVFDDRYDGRADYFTVGKPRPFQSKWGQSWIWETNFIPDVQSAELFDSGNYGAGNMAISYQMAGNVLAGHMAEWPPGKYRKAHHHGGGAVLFIVRSHGYTLLWPQELGMQPFASGHGDEVARVDWQPGSVFSPPTGWFHQHFNTGPVPARQLALRFGSPHYGVQFHDTFSREGAGVSAREGGTVIPYEDEDPEVGTLYRQELAATGVEYQMAEALGTAGR
jgi:mannose-6-phosphate isomerase-like protein (cupin superfamily)